LKCFITLCTFLVVARLCSYYFNKCNTKNIELVCDYVRKHRNGSKFCQKLCNTEQIEFLQCHSSGSGKFIYKVVINGEHLVLKSRHDHGNLPDISGELDILVAWNSSMWIVNYFGHCRDIYAVEPIEETAGQKFGNDDSFIDELGFTNDFNSIIHYCIHFAKKVEKYAASRMSYMLFQNKPSFTEKVKFTRSLFLMLEDMHISSHGRLQMCDVHIDNFGYASNGNLKVIDADDIYLLEDVSRMLGSKKCVTDGDCRIGDYYDCHSHCDIAKLTCSSTVSISNVQNVCNVLMSIIFNEISEDELHLFEMPYSMMANFSKSCAHTLDEELFRIRVIISYINKMEI